MGFASLVGPGDGENVILFVLALAHVILISDVLLVGIKLGSQVLCNIRAVAR